MPNWCNNEVTVWGEVDKLKEFREYCYGEWFHDKCGNQTVWTVDKDATEAPYGEYKDNPDYCGEGKFKDTCDKKRWEFSFRSILPMPKELEHTSSPPQLFDTQEEVDRYVKDYLDTNPSSIARQYATGAMTREYSNYLERTYGADNWYDWSNLHWGTKWDASQTGLNDEGDCLRYDFDTAWCPPEPICHFLRDKFPDVQISWFFREDGMEMAGYL